MDKAGKKTRDIKFYSEKNKHMVTVHSREARAFAKYLESMEQVSSYEAGVALEPARLRLISKVDIRGEYFEQQWESDFCIKYDDGTAAVREIAVENFSSKRAEIEKLELSRRYWRSMGVLDWKIVRVGVSKCL